MDKDASYRIVRETFENSFDKERFVYFVKNLLNSFDDAPFVYRGNFIPDAYKKQISVLERIGKYFDGEFKIDILIVRLKKETSIERARSMQRNFIAWYLNGSRGNELKDAALVAFVSPDNNDWRFSLVEMDYKFEEGKDGKMKVKEEFTPARRWSFLVGANENSHTAQSRLAPIMEDDQNNPVLKQLEEAFSVEVVTKEFFKEYESLFIDLVKELNNNHIFKKVAVESDIDTENFAKKLLGQIVFLYFLQKKRWLGAPQDKSLKQGDENFLQNLFDKKYRKYNNFFNDILEHLFYDALNKKTDKSGTFYRDYFKCQIPFLNGGLFEAEYNWRETKIYLDNEIFSNILEVFNRYNFTVDESSPIDQEVAIDPEMLGKVFENLLSENLRKGKGTYYTPREIVHYMCQESLINYLATESKINEKIIRKLITQQDILSDEELSNLLSEDEIEQAADKNIFLDKPQAKKLNWLLRTIKVVDPACGSGAFLVGMLQEITKACLFLDKWYLNGNKNEYQLKKETIQNSIYGVDIDPGAIEIAKLRLWLSLVVDYELEEIEPLPNLDYKIMQGNSLLEELVLGDMSIKLFDSKTSENKKMKNLLEEDKQTDLFGKSDRQKAIVEKLSKLHKEYFGINELEEKKKKKAEIDKIEQDLIEDSVKEEVEKLEKENKNIGNYLSPGVGMTEKDTIKFQKNLSKQGQIMNVLNEFKKTGVKPFFLWRLYFADIFEGGGFDVVIANPPYIDSEAMVSEQKDLREFITKTYITTKGNWDIYIAFFEFSFKILNSNGVLAFITPDKWVAKPFGDELRKNMIGNLYSVLKAGRKVFETAKVDSIVSLFLKNSCKHLRTLNFKDNTVVFSNKIDKKILQSPFAFDFLFSDNLKLLLKIENASNKISDLSNCENACATSDAYKLKSFIKNLSKNNFNQNKQLKIINTGTIDKYISKWGNREMTYLKDKYLYPVVDKQKFLNSFKNSYSKKSLRSKIIIKSLTLLDACLDSKGNIIPGKSTLVIVDENINKLKFLLAILNSKLTIFYIKEKYPASSYNQGINFTKDMINNFPIPKISLAKQKPFIKLVDQILEKKKENPEADVGELEREIDEMVYELYNLTGEEVGIVKSS